MATIPFTPNLTIKLSSTNFKFPLFKTNFTNNIPTTIFTLQLYTYHTNTITLTSANNNYPTIYQTTLIKLIKNQYIFQLTTTIPTITPNFKNIIEKNLHLTTINCLNNLNYIKPNKSYIKYLQTNLILPHTNSTPNIFLIQDNNNTIMNPKATTYIHNSLQSTKITPNIYINKPTNHFNIIIHNITTTIK